MLDFLAWFAQLDFELKIFIPGNHDFYFERMPDEDVRKIIPENVIYLNDSGVTIGGTKIWGSPISPWFYDWAFNRHRGADIRPHWDMIPADTDILVTHGPVWGILDETTAGLNVGCQDLLDRVRVIQPGYHICGHIHEAYGKILDGGTTFINASVLNVNYVLVNKPWEFEM